MDIPSEIINAVKETQADMATAKPKRKARKMSPLTSRILKAIGNGLRTTSSIAKELGVEKVKVLSNMGHLKASGRVISVKKPHSTEHKYFLATEKSEFEGVNIDIKPKRKYTKRVAKVAKVVKNELTAEQAKAIVEMNHKLNSMTSKLASLELALAEKDKEIWTLECEVFDKKAVIKYLEEKLFALGVRV